MKSYTTLRNLFGTLTNNKSTNNLSLGDQLINDSIRKVCANRDWDFLQKTGTASTVASQQFYNLPYDYDSLVDVSVTNGNIRYTPKEVPDRTFWDLLNQQTSYSSNFPEWYFVFNGQIGFWPTPSTSTSNNITYVYRRRIIDLSIADYTTGTLAATNSSTTLTGTGTTWTTPMIGRWIRITPTDTAASSGDGVWYEITNVGSNTSITLSDAYNGTTITGGAYTIGQMSVIPENFQDMNVYDAAAIYFTTVQPDATKARMFEMRYKDYFTGLTRSYGNKTTDPTINETPRTIVNPNLTVFLT